jgi:hypothetical protein
MWQVKEGVVADGVSQSGGNNFTVAIRKGDGNAWEVDITLAIVISVFLDISRN